jgi:hypothetical protein
MPDRDARNRRRARRAGRIAKRLLEHPRIKAVAISFGWEFPGAFTITLNWGKKSVMKELNPDEADEDEGVVSNAYLGAKKRIEDVSDIEDEINPKDLKITFGVKGGITFTITITLEL